MSDQPPFRPAPFQPVSEPRQLKAFADPIRNRILHILGAREATNQQLASELDEPQAKMLHHVRVLLDAGLIRLVDQRVRGGNVEKYYRATARLYGFRPDPAHVEKFAGPVLAAGLESVSQELAASLGTWPNQPPYWEGRRNRLSAARASEFNDRLLALIAEYWGDPHGHAPGDPEGDPMALFAVMYRFPGEE